MKTTIEAILTTMVGGRPVTREASARAIEKLKIKNRELNANLPLVEGKDSTREELREMNRRAKSDKLIQMVPALAGLDLEIGYATKKLQALLDENDGQITETYLRTCGFVLDMAEEKLGKKVITLNFENEVQL